ncbi:hypothetical protein KY341_06290 [Candidatus Woesearchaeota archaeon]|nr:hypothetical protein [Candidatus Woesearchaeota archaeon]
MRYTNHVKKAVLLMIVLGLLYTGITLVFGVQGAGVDLVASSRANLSGGSPDSIAVQAGNVTEINISGTKITEHWAGFYGEISGNLTLENSNGDVFYDWTGLGGSIAGEVFASADGTVSWSGIGCASEAEALAIEGTLGIDPDDSDRINNTYTSTTHPTFNVGSVSGITGCNATNTYDAGGSPSADAFYQVLLTDAEGDAVYTTLINDTETGFDGSTHDFQLLVGESDAAGTTTVYFYIELS